MNLKSAILSIVALSAVAAPTRSADAAAGRFSLSLAVTGVGLSTSADGDERFYVNGKDAAGVAWEVFVDSSPGSVFQEEVDKCRQQALIGLTSGSLRLKIISYGTAASNATSKFVNESTLAAQNWVFNCSITK